MTFKNVIVPLIHKLKHHTMTTAKKIYNKLTAMNPISTYASSFGSHTSHFAQECADMVRSEILEFIPEGTLAHKILSSDPRSFTEKQLWVIAFELVKNDKYTASI